LNKRVGLDDCVPDERKWRSRRGFLHLGELDLQDQANMAEAGAVIDEVVDTDVRMNGNEAMRL